MTYCHHFLQQIGQLFGADSLFLGPSSEKTSGQVDDNFRILSGLFILKDYILELVD